MDFTLRRGPMRELDLDLARGFSAGFVPVFGNPLEAGLHESLPVVTQPYGRTVWKRGSRTAR